MSTSHCAFTKAFISCHFWHQIFNVQKCFGRHSSIEIKYQTGNVLVYLYYALIRSVASQVFENPAALLINYNQHQAIRKDLSHFTWALECLFENQDISQWTWQKLPSLRTQAASSLLAIVTIKCNPDQISQNPATGRFIPHRKKVRGEREKALDRLLQ